MTVLENLSFKYPCMKTFAAGMWLLNVKNKHIPSKGGSEGSSAFHHSADLMRHALLLFEFTNALKAKSWE